jgi:hypothetical protein
MSSTGSGGVSETVEPKEMPLCFVKYLLGERYVGMLRNWVYTNVARNQVLIPEERRCC